MDFRTLVVLLSLNSVRATSHSYALHPRALYDFLFPALNIGRGAYLGRADRILRDEVGNVIRARWDERKQFDGLGIPQALLWAVQDKYPKFRTGKLEELMKLKILFVGGFDRIALGGWIAATILSERGIKCDLYVIQDEESTIHSEASIHSKELLSYIKANNLKLFPNITFVHAKPFNVKIETAYPELKDIFAEIRDTKTVESGVKYLKKWEDLHGEDYCGIKPTQVQEYHLVVDGIPEVRGSKTPEFHMGIYLAHKVLKAAEKIDVGNDITVNATVSLDIPGLWNDCNSLSVISDAYKRFGFETLQPYAIIHLGAIKFYVSSNKNCDYMRHFVVIQGPVNKALSGDSSTTLISHMNANPEITKLPSWYKEISRDEDEENGMYLSFDHNSILVDISPAKLAQVNCQISDGVLQNPFKSYESALIAKYCDSSRELHLNV